ncbi:MAG: BamA/TamA family outer membrane protein [Burkholderiaceae bacterium]
MTGKCAGHAFGWRVVASLGLTFLLGGCALLPGGRSDDATSRAAEEAPRKEVYRLEVDAPSALRSMLLEYLDLARFQKIPADDALDPSELERLRRAAPAQARELLETEGYFHAEVTVERDGVAAPAGPSSAASAASVAASAPAVEGAAAGPLPVLRMVVEPGPRTRIASVRIDAKGELRERADAGNAAALAKLEQLRSDWSLRSGDFFRQGAWSGAKSTSIAGLRAQGYANADWASTNARIDAPLNSADLTLLADSGPLYRLGPLRIDGTSRYGETTLRRLAQFGPGEPYTEQALLDYQERIQKVGLYEGASVQIDPDVKTADAAPVLVSVKEAPLQQATLGLGYSANTGPRGSLEYTHRRIFGFDWIAKNKLELGPDNQNVETDLISYPHEDLWRNQVSGSLTRLKSNGQTLTGWTGRVGRSKESPRFDRLYYLGYSHARVVSDTLNSDADALSGHYHLIYRNIDSLLLPTTGITASLQGALGYATGMRTFAGEVPEEARGPFARLYSRLTWYRPIGDKWLGMARVEAGQVITKSVIGIPDTLLFRAGGENSVRGYGYRTLAPAERGEAVGGRTLFTASVEMARPFLDKYPQYLGAVFIDAGDAANRWADLSPKFGYGVGARWRSPLGPLSLDLAYGQHDKRFRMHLSVGITF